MELIDHYEEETGSTAMQRPTSWQASIVAILVVPGPIMVEEARRRGLAIQVAQGYHLLLLRRSQS